MKRVTNHTRAGQHGSLIECPVCQHRSTSYHFAWSASGCMSCGNMIDKQDWLFVAQNKRPMNVLMRQDRHEEQMLQAVALIPKETELDWPISIYRNH